LPNAQEATREGPFWSVHLLAAPSPWPKQQQSCSGSWTHLLAAASQLVQLAVAKNKLHPPYNLLSASRLNPRFEPLEPEHALSQQPGPQLPQSLLLRRPTVAARCINSVVSHLAARDGRAAAAAAAARVTSRDPSTSRHLMRHPARQPHSLVAGLDKARR